jgi:hypothetical protein
MKIGIIVDKLQVARWQMQALSRIAGEHEFIVYNCVDGRAAPRQARHALYYLLNLFAVRNRQTRRMPLTGIAIAGRADFQAEQDGGWQRLPASLLETIADDRPAIILKFGMGLLRVPDPAQLAVPILSYHHGDPAHFRGRPAGFHEMDQGRPIMGQVVQILSNRLDSGAVVAFAETKVHPHSYRATLEEAYRHSPLILPRAMRNALAGDTLARSPSGRNYRLPGNARIVLFWLRMAARAIRRLGYGAFYEKEWEVAVTPAAAETLVEPSVTDPLPASSWSVARKPAGYRFIADPFFHPDGDGLLVEALSRATNKGEILLLTTDRASALTEPGRHCSYPAVVAEGGRFYLLPEVSEWSSQTAYRLDGAQIDQGTELDVPGCPRLLDPTPFRTEDGLFLFANDAAEGSSVLRLWFADSLSGPFVEHADSPVRISPAGSRMAGAIVAANGARFRIGQDFSRQYGDGIVLFRIEALSRAEYRETRVRSFRFGSVRGPHTVNFQDGRAVFDFYRNRFAPGAGLRRLRQSR